MFFQNIIYNGVYIYRGIYIYIYVSKLKEHASFMRENHKKSKINHKETIKLMNYMGPKYFNMC